MGTGWRRAFCTTIPRDPADQTRVSEKQQRSPSPSPRSCTRLGFFSSGSSNPSTPRLQSQPVISTQSSIDDHESPRLLECKTSSSTPKSTRTSFLSSSNPTSPRSPLKLSLFRNSFKFRVCNSLNSPIYFICYPMIFIYLFICLAYWVFEFSFSVGTFAEQLWDLLEQREDRAGHSHIHSRVWSRLPFPLHSCSCAQP